MVKTSAVIFDVFGTLIEIKNRRNPYINFLKYARTLGLSPGRQHLELLMTRELDWREAAYQLGIRAGYVKLQSFARELQEELASMTVYPDAAEAIAMLQGAGVRVGLCSNMASGYGAKVRELLPGLDAYSFSFEVGAVKPDPLTYYTACCELGVVPEEQFWGDDRIFMIGDSIRCDKNGARATGLAGFYLNRSGKGDFSNLVDFAQRVVEEKRLGFLKGELKVPNDFDDMGRDQIQYGFNGGNK